MFTGFPLLAGAGTPLGSPKAAVCTWDGALAIVGVAELPGENTFVFTSCRGMTGLSVSGSGSSFLDAILTDGAGTSSTLGFGSAAGTCSTSARDPGRATTIGFHRDCGG